ncbi:MAG: branched-chain amino acid ABC transporter permease [Pseudonocardiaceae bacterium]|nr:branched-chain amino acid ABC transporter permease [Pseudonocardiaceae bacterium]
MAVGTEAVTPTAKRRVRGLPLSLRQVATLAGVLILVGFLALVPTLNFTQDNVFFWNEILIFVLFASSLNLLIGYTGMVSFGHAAYYGAGVYAVGVMVSKWGQDMMLVGLLFGTAVGGLLALVVGALIVRAAGLAFAILTLAFGQLAFTFVYQRNYLGGENGLAGILRGTIGPLDLGPLNNYYYFTLVIVFIAMMGIWLVVNSPLGLAMKSIREDAGRTQFLGMRVRLYKLAVFTLAGTLAGLAGSLRAYHNLFATPEELGLIRSAEPIIMSIIGGMGTFFGPVLGAIGYMWLENWLQAYTSTWIMWIGILLVAVILVFPGGLLGGLSRLRQVLRSRRPRGGWRLPWQKLHSDSMD